jgi:GR25 family glycosyltransferase involved in LPS biosynthesis
MKIDKIYYINLDKRKDRKEFMEDQLSAINVPYERFSAISPTEQELSSRFQNFYKRMDGWLKEKNHPTSKILGTLGCYLSHYFVQKKANESSHGNYLVLEDDWCVKPESLKALKSVFNKGLVSGDWDIFGSFWASHKQIVIKHQGSNGRSRFFNNRNEQPMGGTHFMLFNKRSTSKIINFLDAENVFNIDAVLCNDMLNIYHMKMPITNNNFDSDIQI